MGVVRCFAAFRFHLTPPPESQRRRRIEGRSKATAKSDNPMTAGDGWMAVGIGASAERKEGGRGKWAGRRVGMTTVTAA